MARHITNVSRHFFYPFAASHGCARLLPCKTTDVDSYEQTKDQSMKVLSIFIAVIIVIGAGLMVIAKGGGTNQVEEHSILLPKETSDTIAPGFALLELYTSEGCSSCPPAEKLLNKLVQEAGDSNLSIYPLAFHVDYWNRLGWKDRFSSSRWSDRQRQYAMVFRSESIYTPQLIVNGSVEFVGSDESKVRKEIKKVLMKEPVVNVELSAGVDTVGVVRYACTLDTIPANADLILVLIEKGLASDVSRGENKGKTLTHENVVCLLEQISLDESQRIEGRLEIPEDVDQEQIELIALVQDRTSMKILGATKHR